MIDRNALYGNDPTQAALDRAFTDARRPATPGVIGTAPDRPDALNLTTAPGGVAVRATPSPSPLSVAIDGSGLFVLRSKQSTLYGRLGDFNFDPNGKLCDGDGRQVLGFAIDGNGAPAGSLQPLSIGLGDVSRNGFAEFSIDDRGVLFGTVRHVDARTGARTESARALARIALAIFPAPERLARVGGTAMRPTSAAGKPLITVPGMRNVGVLRSHFLEHGAVDLERDLAAIWRLSRRADADVAVTAARDACQRTALGLVK
ncbi:MAG: hypothetical protein GIW99_05170 [Candidatus Eremiobacteraeota bacterium]|nr:hypothetical protein [Candidatus Eremiobacteraeota bacterium]MBC5827057.1 hypothetical protein [Candidatus Eremiobacteraeota bacterium]